MKHITFADICSPELAILIKDAQFKAPQLRQHYVTPLVDNGISDTLIQAWTLAYNASNKATVAMQKEYLSKLLPVLKNQGIKHLLVADAAYFKTLTKQRKADAHYGYVLSCAIPDFEDMSVTLVPNYTSFMYNDAGIEKLTLGLCAISDHINGNYKELGSDIIHNAYYPDGIIAIQKALFKLNQAPVLAVDIETYSLDFSKAGIATIAFATDEHNGYAFPIDFGPNNPSKAMRKLLADFFINYQGKMIFHNANFDVKVLIYTLYMDHPLDEVGKQFGLEVFNNIHDTKLIAYLSKNSTARTDLSLKALAHEFAGNYAVDVKDVTQVPMPTLLEYNLVDTLATFYVYNKYMPVMVKENQQQIYDTIFLPSVFVLLQMELTGMPMNMQKVEELETLLTADLKAIRNKVDNLPVIREFVQQLRAEARDAANAKLKTKVKELEEFDHIEFNFNSAPQLQKLLYNKLGFPVLAKTDSGAPAVDSSALKKLKSRTEDKDIQELLEALDAFSDADKILGTFVKAFKKAKLKDDGWHYLHGSFNLGGTVSGRLSSSAPNLQNIPSGGNPYAKYVKECFSAPDGWLFMGADFASLEDRISALTTKDPEKLKVYQDGYDGHCLRAYAYFKEQMPDIDPTSVDSINSIADHATYSKLRQKSKGPTFLLTYGGTWMGLVGLGFSEEEAKQIEKNYHDLYQASDAWVQAEIDKACQTGYVECAFGLRVRTPLLRKAIMNHERTPYEALKEGRTAGNALGQSYGLLNNRAAIEVQEKVLASKHRYDIIPVAHIHDAQYFLVKDDIDAVSFLNDVLVTAMLWQDLDAIRHPDVELGGELSLFFPNWAHDITLQRYASQDAIKTTVQEYLKCTEDA